MKCKISKSLSFFLLSLFFTFFQTISLAQDFIETLVEQPVGVFHLGNRTSDTREVVQVKLPPNTIRWFYTFSAYRDKAAVDRGKSVFNLFSELSKFIDESGATAFALDKISNPPGTDYADAFLLLSANDVKKFENRENDFIPVREGSRKNLISGKFIIDNPSFTKGYQYLGFRNNNLFYGVNIQVQIVAVVRELAPMTKWTVDSKNIFFKVFSSLFYSVGLGKYLDKMSVEKLVSCIMSQLTKHETPESLKGRAGYELFEILEKYGNECDAQLGTGLSKMDLKPDAVSSLIQGKWKDENSVFTLFKDGSMSIKWDNGSSAFGNWKISDGLLKFSINKANYDYFIVELSDQKLVFELVGNEKEKYTAIKQIDN